MKKCIMCKENINSGVEVGNGNVTCYQCYSKFIGYTKEIKKDLEKYNPRWN